MRALARFHDAQDRVYSRALAELRSGRKQSHWMWFIFPQIAGLGVSETSRRYAIASIEEARSYLADPVLGARLRECIAAVLEHSNRTALAIFGRPDDMKFRSCLTLFEAADPKEVLFGDALAAFYGGSRDPKTLELLYTRGGPSAVRPGRFLHFHWYACVDARDGSTLVNQP